ncbi:hypothetical protein [Bradyrhizobium sp. G127]|uniref:hypothetical protein n=1 Tax=Bradyrhizobium sp. G127 TaxID=2904800 RepID=UPI001F295ACD|nr:hypothetical protein [Bradyrhizobium sp. G127]MCF2522399.1 hypothetical protein [Bradyrhizobium sp. G127]
MKAPPVERIYNIFLHFENGNCSKLGYEIHETGLDDQSAVSYLQERVSVDCKTAQIYWLKSPFTEAEYYARARLAQSHHLIDDFFEHIGATLTPLFVVTTVVNGEPTVNYASEHNKPLNMKDVRRSLGEEGEMIDWLEKYTSADGVDIPQLIHDDYFLAIKLTFNAGLHVSSMKLLLSCIDSVAYIEFGNDKPTPFIDWLDAYADLKSLEISAAELWELRNGILHMSNISSKKVRTNKVRRISFRAGGPTDYPKMGTDGIFYFDFYELISAYADAIGRWIATYNDDRPKFAKFVERYDETISDSRVSFTKLASKAARQST